MKVTQLLSLLLIAVTVTLSGQRMPSVSSNGIAAQVEDRIITLEELRREVEPLVPQIRASSATRGEFEANIAQVTRDILQSRIDRILVIREFNEEGYQIPEQFLESAYDDFLIEEFSGDRAAYLEHLRARGMSDLDFRDELKEKIIVDYMRSQHMRDRASISPERINEYYEQNKSRFIEEESVKLRMIVLKARPGESSDLLKQRAQMVSDKAAAGEDFAALARQHSSGDYAEKGGDWGFIGRAMLKQNLSDVAFSLQAGETSDLVVSGDNYYLLRVEERREAGIKELERVRAEIEEAIATRIARLETEAWLDSLRKNAYIMIHLRDVDRLIRDNSPDPTIQMSLGESDPS